MLRIMEKSENELTALFSISKNIFFGVFFLIFHLINMRTIYGLTRFDPSSHSLWHNRIRNDVSVGFILYITSVFLS